MRTITLKPQEYQPQAPKKKDYKIGIIGCGGIVQNVHLRAYQQFGYTVVAACDLRPEALEAVRQRWGIQKLDTDPRVVLDDPEVQIVDLAVHANQRLPLVKQIAAAGKPVFSQKPFAMNYADAKAMVEICRKAKVPLMINQQSRWAPMHRAAKVILERGLLGHLYSVLHVNRSWQDQPGSWYAALKHFNIVDHGIHFIDLSRHFTGLTPERVKATTVMVPGQAAVSPMIYTINCEYADAAQVMTTLHFNNIIRTNGLHSFAWYFDGTEGSMAVTGQQLEIARKETPGERLIIPIRGQWFPDAFGGSMGEMMQALTEGREPLTSGADNLNSIKIAYAAVESSETGKTVELKTIK